MADTIFAERGSARRMERESRRIVRTGVFALQCPADTPTVLPTRSPALRYLFMRRGPCGETSFSDSRRYPVKPDGVRLSLRMLTHASGRASYL
jgi:hypothetical protein